MKKILLIALATLIFAVTVSASYPDSIQSKADIQQVIYNQGGNLTQLIDTLRYACYNPIGILNLSAPSCNPAIQDCNKMDFRIGYYNNNGYISISCFKIENHWAYGKNFKKYVPLWFIIRITDPYQKTFYFIYYNYIELTRKNVEFLLP